MKRLRTIREACRPGCAEYDLDKITIPNPEMLLCERFSMHEFACVNCICSFNCTKLLFAITAPFSYTGVTICDSDTWINICFKIFKYFFSFAH